MNKLVCHLVDKHRGNHIGVDQYIAEKMGWNPNKGNKGINPVMVAALRGVYDQYAEEKGISPLVTPTPGGFTTEQLDEACKKLMNFRVGTKQRQSLSLANVKKHTAKAYDNLRHAFSLHQRKSRINYLSSLFSIEVDHLMQKQPNVSRQAIVNGFKTVGGTAVGGPAAIFDDIFHNLLELRQQYYQSIDSYDAVWKVIKQRYDNAWLPGAAHPEDRALLDFKDAPKNAAEYKTFLENRFKALTSVLENWDSILPFVMKDLHKREGVNLSIKKEFLSAASVDSFGDNDIADKWDASEAIREGWQRNNDLESSFGSIGQQVRRLLSTIYEVEQIPIFEEENGVRKYKGIRVRPILDDLGNNIFKDPVQVHQYLSEYLKGVQDSEDVKRRLIKPGTDEARIPWMQPLVDLITSDSSQGQNVTQLFVDFKKNFQPYSTMYEDEDESYGLIKSIKTRILNKPKNLLADKYKSLMSSKGVFPSNVKIWGFTPVFEEGSKGGKVNWERLAELREKVLEWTHEDEPEKVGIFNKTDTYKTPTPALLTDRRHDTAVTVNGETKRLTYDMKRDFLLEVFTSLGYDVTVDAIDEILNSNDIYKVREQLEWLFNPKGQSTGLLYALGDNVKDFEVLTSSNATAEEKQKAIKALDMAKPTFRRLYDTMTKKEGKKETRPIKEHSEKLLDIISKYQEGKRVESRVRYQGNTMYSYVNPSYLGDRLETIESFVNENNHEGLFKFLNDEYLHDPFFVDNDYIATNGQEGKILNMWLAELVNACKNTKVNLVDTVAAIFNYERDLGNDDKKFEDFTSKEHGADMLIHFFADEMQNKGYGGKGTKNINKKLSALYPVFILGDAGVSKYIRAPRIVSSQRVDKDGNPLGEADAAKTQKIVYRFDSKAKEKVIDQFYNLYIQEQRRMVMDEAMSETMYANGKPVKHAKGEFSFLTFLNPTSQEYTSDYELPIDSKTGRPTSDETTVKEVIRKYLENATLNNLKRADGSIIPSFKQRLLDLGLLETAKDAKGKDAYKFLNNAVSPENINERLSDFYWNTKLATAQQLQLMTIDPSFYQNTKDLQKRYKEIHAPGNLLDVLARDRNGDYYSPDGMEKCVYFKDLKVNAEVSNPEFLESILRTFAKPGVDVEAAIAEGIVHPKEKGSPEETVRTNKLIDILGNETFKKIYEPYMGNTLTDGQGYRTLTSYRRVMGMAGKWTEDMESAYNYIMAFREEYTKKGLKIPDEAMKKIANFVLVLQPIKPYMFTHEKVDVYIQKTDDEGNKLTDADGKPIVVKQTRNVPVQHKYAEALIIPELLPEGNQLRDLGLWMDDAKVDLVGSDKICKVGAFGQVSLEGCKSKEDLVNAMGKGVIHNLSYRDYRIQTNVPEHINSSQLFGTQVRKLIMAGLNRGDYSSYLNGQKVNLSTDGEHNTECSLDGKNLLALYNSLICANIFDSYNKFEQNAKSIDNVSEMLQQSTIGSLRESMDNIFSYVVTGNEEATKEFMIPLFEGGLEHDAAALLLSTFKRIVNKQQISGGSAVQVSAFGINGYDKDGGLRYVQDSDNKANILYAEIEMPFDRSMTIDVQNTDGTKSKQTVSLNYDQYCFEDGNLRPTGKALEKGTKEWKKYQSYTYKEVEGKLVPCKYNDANAKVYKPLIEEEYPDILSILAYRIPSENDYSMINCQIKRFTSKMAGGTLKVPSQGTTIAGFDFDIDKLYFMQREYHKRFSSSSYVESKFSNEDKDRIWASIFEDNEELERSLRNARAEAEAKDSNLVEVKTLKNGRQITKSKTTLNSYYDQVNGESITGKSKRDIFAEKAQELGIEPTQNITKEEGGKLDEYDFTKTPEENVAISRSRSNNLLISLIQARLMDPETMKQRYTPGGFEDAKHTARFLRELMYGNLEGIINNGNVDIKALKDRHGDDTDPEPNYSATDPYTILVYNQQNQIAGKLIGIFANQNTHNAFVSCMDKFELKEALDFCGHHNMKDLLHKNNPTLAAEINLNVAQFLSASVDAVKDPVLNFMNLNTITADSAAMLARLGYSMDEIGLFLSQPVIKDICQESFNSGKSAKTCISNMQEKLKQYTSANNSINLTSNDLALGIINDRLSKEKGEDHDKFLQENAKIQSAVLDMFSKVFQASQDVSDFVTNTKFTASNAVSSTFGGLYAQQLRVNNYLDRFNKDNKNSISYDIVVAKTAEGAGVMSKPIDNDESLVSKSTKDYLHYVRFNPFAYEQAMYDTNRKALKLLSKYFPYETGLYKRVRGRMNDLCRIGALGEDEINDIHSNLPVALLSRQTASEFHGESLHRTFDEEDGKYKKSNVTNRTYYREDFAKDLEETIHNNYDDLGNLAIFKYITTHSEEVVIGKNPTTGLPVTKEVWSISMQDVGGMDADTKEAIKESWAYLMEVDDEGYFKNPKYAEIGKDLFMYCFYQMGFEFSPISFMHLAPTAVKDNIIVERNSNLELNSFNEGDIKWEDSNSNDVIVWSANVDGSMERLAADFDVDRSMIGELQDKSYRLSDKLTLGSINNLVNAAKSHPELKFKIDRTLTQEEFDLFKSIGRDVPANIYFSKDTLASVSQDGISYGRNRTYRQFLNEILHGENNDLITDDFAKQFILNHLDNAKFVFDVSKCNETLSKILKEQAQKSLNVNANVITFDVSSYLTKDERDKKALSSFVKINEVEGKIHSAAWSPVILYKGSYYMAESNNAMGFNANQSMQMTYIKVAPMGSKKSLKYDGIKEVKPSMRYQSYYGETDEDLGHAEYTRKVSPTKVENQEKKEGGDTNNIVPTPEANGSTVGLQNRDSSSITKALKDIQEATEVSAEDIAKVSDKLLNLDLRNQVLNEEDSLNDDTFDAVDEIMEDILGRRAWRKCAKDLKETLVKAIFEYNKNPKYISPQSSVNEGPLEEGNNSFTLPTSIRTYLEDQIAREYIAAIQRRDGRAMSTQAIEGLKAAIASNSDKDISDTIEALKKAYRKDGVMMLDDEGNPLMGC